MLQKYIGMLHTFHTDVTKVYRDVAYVAMVVHYVANIDSQCFIYFFRRMLQVCLSGYCICFAYMLQVLSGCRVCLQ